MPLTPGSRIGRIRIDALLGSGGMGEVYKGWDEKLGGSSTQVDTHTSAGSLIGTLHYMSPEQARGLPLSEATDVYSLGILLQEMLSGERAYEATPSANDLLVRVRSAQVLPFDSGDRPLNDLLERMLALYPTDRPSAEQIARQIESVRERPALFSQRSARMWRSS